MNVDEMVQGVQDAVTVRRVFGEPVERGGVTVIPVAAVQGGGGGGSDAEHNGGGGFGLRVRPVGSYVIKDGRVRFEPAVDATRIAVAALVTFGVIAFFWRPRR